MKLVAEINSRSLSFKLGGGSGMRNNVPQVGLRTSLPNTEIVVAEGDSEEVSKNLFCNKL